MAAGAHRDRLEVRAVEAAARLLEVHQVLADLRGAEGVVARPALRRSPGAKFPRGSFWGLTLRSFLEMDMVRAAGGPWTRTPTRCGVKGLPQSPLELRVEGCWGFQFTKNNVAPG